MITGLPVRVETTRLDRCSRSGSVQFGKKRVMFPSICMLLASASQDVRPYIESRTVHPSDTARAPMIIARHTDRAVLDSLLWSAGQTTLSGSPAVLSQQDLLGATPMIIDPCTEYTWYGYRREELADDLDTPVEIRRLARSMHNSLSRNKNHTPNPNLDPGRRDLHDKFWHGLLRDDSAAPSIVSKMLAVQYNRHADIALPPVPAAYDDRLLDVSDKINRLARAVWTGDNCAYYIIVTPELFANESYIDALIHIIRSSSARLTVLKFKNHTLEQVPKVVERLMLRKILEAINEAKSSDPSRIFILLEAGHAMYPAAAGGFDIVSTGMTGIDYETVGYARGSGHGSYYSPRDMTVLKWSVAKKMLAGNGLPCSCEVCRRMKPNPSRNEWNFQRRSHYVHCTSRMLADLTRLVGEQKMELAKQRISKSAISNFAGSLPYIL